MESSSDYELLKAFIEDDGSKPSGRDERRVELVTRLRDHIVWHVSRQWPGQRARYEDLEADAFVLLMSWRAEKRLFATEELWRLAWRLVQQVSKAEFRELEREKEGIAEFRSEPPPERASPEEISSHQELLRRLGALLALLPEADAEVIEAQVAESEGHGPELCVALGCDPAAARKRLERARIALAALALEHGLGPTLREAGLKRFGGSK
jgi:hypothetical protein